MADDGGKSMVMSIKVMMLVDDDAVVVPTAVFYQRKGVKACFFTSISS